MRSPSTSGSRSGPLEVVAFTAANSCAYLAAVFQAYREGRIVLALPQSTSIKNLPGTQIVDRQRFEDDPGWFTERFDPIDTDAPAQIAFSSGTTGRPKPLLLTHRALADVVHRVNAMMEVDDSISEYIGVPVTFSFGFGRCRAVAAAGGRAFLPAHGFDPSEIARMLGDDEINAISAVPTLWRMVLANPNVIGEVGQKVRWIEIGSQYMSGDEKAALRRLFPNAKIVQHYGLTEASRSTLLDISTTDESRLESVGRATGAVEVSVDGSGQIRVRGPHLAEGIVTGAGIKPIVDEEGWLTTSDLGRVDDGWVYYDGRVDDLINCGGVKIDPGQFEQQLVEQLGSPGDVMVSRVADQLRGERVLVASRHGAGLDRTRLESVAIEIADRYGLAGGGSLVFREVESFPTTATGKPQRAKLAELPDVSHETSPPAATPSSSAAASNEAEKLQALWADILGVPSVSIHESFYDLGGDSLSALTAIMKMESIGIEPAMARGIFEGKSIAEMLGLDGTEQPTAPTADSAAHAEPSAAQDDRTSEMQALWAEVLGVSSVSIHDSFYDLGGDSLSALTAIMRMEAMGIEPKTARGIFEGKSIAEMTGKDSAASAPPADPAPTPPASAPSPVDPAGEQAAELQKLWAEVLAVPSVSIHDSFYDLGGDSLSALTAIMRMEAMGIDPKTARGIFEGKSIAEMAGIDAASSVGPGDASAEARAATPPPTAAATGQAAELQKVWAEVLAVPSVTVHDSFYDLGGDSLSALTAIMRMEAMGIDPKTARGIFEGKSIAEMVGLESAASSAAVGTSPSTQANASQPVVAATGQAAELQKVWAEVLAVPSVSIHDSFYDQGGDSLSALTAIMRMEAMGIDPQTARGIFEGKSIAEMTGDPRPADPPMVEQPVTERSPEPVEQTDESDASPVLTLADSINAVHAIRGILILWVVVVHWLPGVLVRVMDNGEEVYRSLTPFWRYGTPGFAMVFGIGVGALGIPHYHRNRELFRKSTWFNVKLIVAGVLLFALFQFLEAWGEGTLSNPNLVSVMFYSALTYYALAVLTMPLIMKVLSIGRDTLITIIVTCIACMAIHEVLHFLIADARPYGVLELFKILLTAKYGYFRMTAIVMIGVAIGFMFRSYHNTPRFPSRLAWLGLSLVGAGVVTLRAAVEDNRMDNFGLLLPWHMMIYGGVTLMLLGLFARINRTVDKVNWPGVRWLNALLITSGILALPIFVGHKIVLPAEDFLVAIGVPAGLALLGCVGTFMGALAWATLRLMRFVVR